MADARGSVSPFMLILPWANLRRPEPGREYVALLSELYLDSFRTMPAFFSYSGKIQTQLKRSPGLIGFSLNAHLFRKKFWTLSVWESDEAIALFVHERPHKDVMEAMRGRFRNARFIRWRISGFQCPPSWAHAFRMREEGL
jgi:heme-degrading monooxygenase HmoA